MQLRHLRYFIAVAEHGSIVHAARRLHVAQPSISKQMQDLEREVGCPLFERLPRGIRLTTAGEAFLLEARRTVEMAARAIESARDAGERTRERLTLAMGRLTTYPSILPRLLGRFRSEHPDTEIITRSLSDVDQAAGLQSGSVTAAIAWMCKVPASDFASYVLEDCAVSGVIMPSSHPLAKESEISLAQLQPLTRLHHPRRLAGELYRQLRLALYARGLDPSKYRAVPMDVTSITMHIAGGNAYLLANEAMASSYTEGNDAVLFRRFVEPPIPLWLTLYWSAEKESVLVRTLVDTARCLTSQVEAVA